MRTHSSPRFARFLLCFPAAAVFFAVTLASCRSVASPTPAAAPRTTAAPANAPAVASPTRCNDARERCLREALPALTEALPRVAADPTGAAVALRASRSAAARAWVAYLAHHAGDDAEAERVLAALADEDERPSLAPTTASTAARALYLAREQAELLGDDAMALLPCAIFAWDPEAARDAFAPLHGSTRDALVAPFKRRCVDEALSAAMAPAARARVSAALAAVQASLFRQWPVPSEGTMWVGTSIAAQETLRDAVLLLPPRPSVDGDAAARAVVGRIARRDASQLARLAAYRRASEGQVGALTGAICAVARARGVALTGGQCQGRARRATIAAFTAWVGALNGL